jgi:hypothetical protein
LIKDYIDDTGGKTTVISLSSLVTKNILDIDTLSGCCDDNFDRISALSAAIYSPSFDDTWNIYFNDPDTGEPGSIITNINKLALHIQNIDIGDANTQINVNTTNINTLSGDIITINNDITNINTDIDSLSSFIDINTNNITTLTECCDDNKGGLSALSAEIYGDVYGDTYTDNADKSIIQHINHLYQFGGGSDEESDHGHLPDPRIDTNTTDIDNNTTNIDINTTDITTLSGIVSGLEDCCSDNQADIINLSNDYTNITTQVTTIAGDYVDKTTTQVISGEKTFDDPTTIAAPLSAGENVTIGVGETIFNVCTALDGSTEVKIPGLKEDGFDDISGLPVNAVYIKDIGGVKVLAIKRT